MTTILKNIRLWKDAFKSVIYGATSGSSSAPEFGDWTDSLTINPRSGCAGNIPKIIWFYWDKPERPDLVRATIERVRRLNPDHEIRVIDLESAAGFIDASFLKRADLRPQHKSDLIRLELLAKYGGIWSDATCIYNEDFSWVQHVSREKSPDLIAYYRNKDTFDRNFPILESWFLACPPEAGFIVAWKDEFRKVIDVGSHEYFNRIRERADFSEIRQGITRGEYLVVYFAAQIAMREMGNCGFYLRKAEDSPYLYQDMVKWDREWMATYLCRLRCPDPVPPVIKLTHSNRYLLPFMISHGLVRKDSILGQFLKG